MLSCFHSRPAIGLAVSLACTGYASVTAAQVSELDWVRQLGTSSVDESRSVAIDSSGNAYIAGLTRGSLAGPSTGGLDGYLAKYDSMGTLLWSEQIGAGFGDTVAFSVAVDAGGNAYVGGGTSDILGASNAGGRDAVVMKFDPSGNTVWTEQFGTTENDGANAVAVDVLGNVYVVGQTFGSLYTSNAGGIDTFLTKLDATGAEQWTRQIGTSGDDEAQAVAVDSTGNVYLSGWTEGALDGSNGGAFDAFVSKYDSSGNEQWTRQQGLTEDETADGIAVDAAGNVYISGTQGLIDFERTVIGGYDTYVTKYDSAGTAQWTSQLDSAAEEVSLEVAVDAAGNTYLAGWTDGSLDGPNAGESDVILVKYDTTGAEQWIEQFGTSGSDIGWGVAVGDDGELYITGWTHGPLDGANAGQSDAFLARYVPEPTSLALLALSGVLVMSRRRYASF